jgi:hypothetical protein
MISILILKSPRVHPFFIRIGASKNKGSSTCPQTVNSLIQIMQKFFQVIDTVFEKRTEEVK